MAEPAVTLTKARQEMLAELVAQPGPYADHYAPLKWLWSNGYAEEYGRGGLFRATPAGRALLDALKEEGEGHV